MSERITCQSCGNPCHAPSRPGRFLCPRCRRPLASLGRDKGTRGPGDKETRRGKGERRIRVARLVSMVAPIVAVVAVMLIARRAMVMPEVRALSPAPVLAPAAGKPYPGPTETLYRYRIRQLKADLARDRSEYLVLSRLGTLHLRLARHAAASRAAEQDYKEARRYFERAAAAAKTRREYEWSISQREACAARAPVTDAADPYLNPDMIASPPPPSVDIEGQLLMRVQFLEGRRMEMPKNARLLARLGLTYVRLSQSIASRERRAREHREQHGPNAESRPSGAAGSRSAPWGGPTGSWVPDGAECRRLAGERLREALSCSRTRELRADIYRSLAELSRSHGDLESAVVNLRRVVALQPNNWPAHLHLAALLSRLGRADEADAATASAARWHTPEWL